MTTIHVLGSSGFIGRAIQRATGDLSIHCWSHQQTNRENYFDLFDPSSWEGLLNKKPKIVILLAWPGLPNYEDKIHISQNLPACVELIDKLIDAGMQRLVVTGTCYEYGIQNGLMIEDNLTDPLNCYAIAKDALRRTIANKCTSNGVDWCWTRIFYVYGEGQNPKSLLPSLYKAIDSGDEYFPMGSGEQIRDFVHVSEVAVQLLRLACSNNAKGVYNIGSGEPRSILQFVEEAISSYGGTIKLQRGALINRADEPIAFWASIKKIKNV